MANKLIVAPAPHVQSSQSTQSIMRDVLAALLPALAVSTWVFGWSVLLLTLLSVACCVLFEFLIQRFLVKGPCTVGNLSAAVTGVLLAFNLPVSIPWWIVAVGAFVAIAVAKMTFGGLGKNPFNPALVGRVFLLVAYPVQMTSFATDAFTGATPLAAMKYSPLFAGANLPDLFIGNVAGSMGEVAAAALLLGFLYLLWRRVITWHIPVVIDGPFRLLRSARTRLDGCGTVGIPALSPAGGRSDARRDLHGDGLFDLADDGPRRGDLCRGHRCAHDVHPPLGGLSRGHVLCDPHHERRGSSD